jgi:hypothetical protein
MCASASNRIIWTPRIMSLLLLSLWLLRAQPVLADRPPGVGPAPHLHAVPCISTGLIFTVNAAFCFVRNVGVVSHNATSELRNGGNQIVKSSPLSLGPGEGVIGAIAYVSDESAVACILTTDEGTTDALKDVAVVLQVFDKSGGAAGETEGQIFQECAPSSGKAPPP